MITAGRTLTQIERGYLRRIRAAAAVALLLHLVTAVTFPKSRAFFPLPARVGYEGPLRMYPELSVRRDAVAEREELAARMVASGFAFRVEPLDVEGLSREAGEELKRQPVARQKRESRSSLNDDEGLDMRTAGLPVVTTPEDYLLHLEKPIYPQDALELGIEGRIVLKALVGLDGIVKRVVVVESHVIPSMEQAAVDAVLKCRFRPYRQDGEPAAFWARFPIVFRITNG